MVMAVWGPWENSPTTNVVEKLPSRHAGRAIMIVGTQHSLARNMTVSSVEGQMLLHHTVEYRAVMEDTRKCVGTQKDICSK